MVYVDCGTWLSQDDTVIWPQTLSCLSVVRSQIVRLQELWSGTATPGGCRFDRSLVQSKLAHACSIVAEQQYMHAQPEDP